ncbi:hypothetical protein WME75_19080 [Sorangium sp. So ce1014]|uniref:hypothetical protein n=1 Tax=Sorangium sp. So ce1014 TaxID=3133326 RepID=UPI003F644534
MENLKRFSSRASLPWRAADLFILASLAATSLIVGGCSMDLQILAEGMGNGGGGERRLTEGTIEVLSIDDAAITVLLEDSGPDHVVPRCP